MAGFASGTPRSTDQADDKRATRGRGTGDGKPAPVPESGSEDKPPPESLTVVLEKLREAAAAHDKD
jgi:hypothetical protein